MFHSGKAELLHELKIMLRLDFARRNFGVLWQGAGGKWLRVRQPA